MIFSCISFFSSFESHKWTTIWHLFPRPIHLQNWSLACPFFSNKENLFHIKWSLYFHRNMTFETLTHYPQHNIQLCKSNKKIFRIHFGNESVDMFKQCWHSCIELTKLWVLSYLSTFKTLYFTSLNDAHLVGCGGVVQLGGLIPGYPWVFRLRLKICLGLKYSFLSIFWITYKLVLLLHLVRNVKWP